MSNIELYATLETNDPELAFKQVKPLYDALGIELREISQDTDLNWNADGTAYVGVEYNEDPETIPEWYKLFDMLVDIDPKHLDTVLDYFEEHAEEYAQLLLDEVDVEIPLDDVKNAVHETLGY